MSVLFIYLITFMLRLVFFQCVEYHRMLLWPAWLWSGWQTGPDVHKYALVEEKLWSVCGRFSPWKKCVFNYYKEDTNWTKCIGKSSVLFQKALGKRERSAWGRMNLSVYVNAVFLHSDAVLDSLIERVRRSDYSV